MTKLHFAAVLRHGGAYNARYVNNLFNNIVRQVRAPFTFSVLTDKLDVGLHPAIRILPLRHPWTGWWSKIEMFAPGLWADGRVWYFDLDTILVGNITEMVTDPSLGDDFYALRDFGFKDRLASGVMTWKVGDPAVSEIYNQFALKPEAIMSSCCTLGDQCWVGIANTSRNFLQDKYPGKFVSFKIHCPDGKCIQQGASVVAFHGLPRPLDAIKNSQYAWVQRYWK